MVNGIHQADHAVGADRLFLDYVEVSVALAYEYQQLGKWTRAETVFAKCSALVDAGKVSVKPIVVLLLRHADYASCRGDHEKG